MANEDATVVTDQVETEATQTDSTPVENNTSVTADNALDDDAFDDIDSELDAEESSAEEVQETPQADETQSQQQTTQGDTTQLAPKSENRFQQLANDNRELRQNLENPSFLERQLAELRSRESQYEQEQSLLNEVNPNTGDFYTPAEAERMAFQQSREAQQQQVAQERYNLEVQRNQGVISSEAQQALKDFPMFDETSKEYNPQLAAQADALLGQSLIFDQNNTLVGSNIRPYELYKTIADSAATAAAKAQALGQAEAQKATQRMLANADMPGGSSDAKSSDEDLSDFDSTWDS